MIIIEGGAQLWHVYRALYIGLHDGTQVVSACSALHDVFVQVLHLKTNTNHHAVSILTRPRASACGGRGHIPFPSPPRMASKPTMRGYATDYLVISIKFDLNHSYATCMGNNIISHTV